MFQVDLLKSVVLLRNMQLQFPKPWLTSSASKRVPLHCFWCLQTAKSLISFCRGIDETVLQQLLAKPSCNCCCSLFSLQLSSSFITTVKSDMPTLPISAGDCRLLTHKKPPARFWKYPTFLAIFEILSCKNILANQNCLIPLFLVGMFIVITYFHLVFAGKFMCRSAYVHNTPLISCGRHNCGVRLQVIAVNHK